MKRILIVLFSVLTIFLVGCDFNLRTYKEISYNDFLKMKEDNKSFPLVVGSSECSACANYKITMEQFIKKNQIKVYFIDIKKLSESEYNKIKSEVNFTGTPTTVFYKDGVITSYYNRIDGATSIDVVTDYFKTNEYIK